MLLLSTAYAGQIALPKDTEIKVKFGADMQINSGNLEVGIPLLIYLAEDISMGGVVVIKAGTEGKAEVIEVIKASAPGKPGYIKVEFVELGVGDDYKTKSGNNIKLTGFVENQGKGKGIISKILIYGFFTGGSQGKINASQIYPAIVKDFEIMTND